MRKVPSRSNVIDVDEMLTMSVKATELEDTTKMINTMMRT